MLSTLVGIASLISSAAVLASVVYLALQTRQSARNQRSIIDRGRSEQVGAWLQFIATPEISSLMMRGRAGDPTMTPEERQRFIWCIHPMILHYEDSFYQHREGMMSDLQFASVSKQFRASVQFPGVQAVWLEVRDVFPVEFRDFAEAMLENKKP